jgi:hypothetical protein
MNSRLLTFPFLSSFFLFCSHLALAESHNGMDPSQMAMMGMMGGGNPMQMMMMSSMMGGGGGGGQNSTNQALQSAISDMKQATQSETTANSTALQNLSQSTSQGMSKLYSDIQSSNQASVLPDQSAAIEKATAPLDNTKFLSDMNHALSDNLNAINSDGATRSATIAAAAPPAPHPSAFSKGVTLGGQLQGLQSNSSSGGGVLGPALQAMSPKATNPTVLSPPGQSHSLNASSTISEKANANAVVSKRSNLGDELKDLSMNTYNFPKGVLAKRQLQSR